MNSFETRRVDKYLEIGTGLWQLFDFARIELEADMSDTVWIVHEIIRAYGRLDQIEYALVDQIVV